MKIIDCQWNHNGTILAVAGETPEQSNVVQFFNSYGEVLEHIKIFDNIYNHLQPLWCTTALV